MAKAARKSTSAGAEAEARPVRPARKQKLPVLLVTGDDALWPQIGADLPTNLVLKQVDSVDELLGATPGGEAAIILWDARNQADLPQILSRFGQHSTRFAIIALDEAGSAGVWTLPLQHRQVTAHVAVPISAGVLSKALDSASEEVLARIALLGESGAPAPAPVERQKTFPLVPVAVGAALLAATVVFLLTRHGSAARPVLQAAAATAPVLSETLKTQNGNEEKLDALIDKAQQAMTERHFIDPAAGSALSLYRDALLLDPKNGEAHQALQRLAEILIARVQSALDERKFDVALQSLETARSIDPTDHRLAGLDEKIAALRAELGPAQIMAAINAQNFDRAQQLIEDAARAKALPAGRLAQLRDEVRRHREEFELTRLMKLADTRLQQDKLVEPRNDSAAFYLDQARQTGAPPASLQVQTQELQRRLVQNTRSAIDQRHFGDADRWLAELHNLGVAPATVTAMQHDLTAARGAAVAKPEQPQAAELAQARLAQGKLIEPDNDSALFYLAQLRAADPKNASLVTLSAQAQSQLLERARSMLDTGDFAATNGLLQQAATLGASPELDSLTERLHQKQSAAAATPLVLEQSLTRLERLEINYPGRALQSGVEGWVELGYTVKTDGSVAGIKVLNSTPAGTFDQSAIRAVAKLRYQAVMRDGKPISVGTQIRVMFRIPK